MDPSIPLLFSLTLSLTLSPYPPLTVLSLHYIIITDRTTYSASDKLSPGARDPSRSGSRHSAIASVKLSQAEIAARKRRFHFIHHLPPSNSLSCNLSITLFY